MKTMARLVVLLVIGAVLIGGTLLVVHFLKKSRESGLETASVPVPVFRTDASPPVPSPLPVVPPAPVAPVPVTPPVPPAPPPAPATPPAPPAPQEPPVTERSTPNGLELADQGLAFAERGLLVEAQKRLSEAVKAGVGGDKGRRVRQTLQDLAEKIQFSRDMVPNAPDVKTYKVASGDSLSRIGWQFLVPYPLLMRINGLTSTSIQAGQVLKVVQGPVHVRIIKRDFELQAWLGDVCVKTYPVGIGQRDSTPEGLFAVKMKIKDPPYQPQHRPRSDWRDSRAPDNPLGTRWIDIGNHYGIHGTIDPSSIGATVSEGCIRMFNKDAEELYDMVLPGASKVEVLP